MNVFLDIETIPAQPEQKAREAIAEGIQPPAQMSKAETIADWHAGNGKYAGVKEAAIEEAYRATGLDGGKGEVISIAWAVGDAPVSSLSISDFVSDGEMIAEFLKHLDTDLALKGGSARPYFIGHRIVFDLKFLFRRCVVLGIRPLFKLNFRGRHGSDYWCNAESWCEFREYISQDALCKTLGIEGKPSDIDGSKVWDFYKAGDIERIAEYNRDDVEKCRKVYHRINFTNQQPIEAAA